MMKLSPEQLLNNPFLNKGTAFTESERKKYGLAGLLPPYIQTLDEQVQRVYMQYQRKANNLEKRNFLMQIFDTNRVLFYKLFSTHIVEFMPIIYDPTIADAIEQYSELYVNPQNAAFLSIDAPDHLEEALKQAANGRDIRLIVVSDSEAILGIGDWGTNGVNISVGKLMVYTVAAGIDPKQVLPVVLDVGTNNQKLIDDPLYLGNKHKRVKGERYYDFVDQFVQTAKKLFPKLYLHFEDFGRDNAANILNKYKDKITVFNDDIQGTGIIVLAGIFGALNISKQKFTDQIYMTFGAGTAGAGIADRVYQEMIKQGLSPEEARQHFYMVDKQGLLFDDDPTLTPQQKPFARKRSEFQNADELTSLEASVKAIHPTILVGTSTQGGAFKESIIKEMAAHTDRPIIFPISNPTQLSEAVPNDLIKWTKGRALIATGVPSQSVAYNGVNYEIGQANNALIYPGIGLGVLASTAGVLNDAMISQAAHSLGGIVDPTQPGAAVLPPVSHLSQFSDRVAAATGQSAIDQKITKEPITDITKAMNEMKWIPEYEDLDLY